MSFVRFAAALIVIVTTPAVALAAPPGTFAQLVNWLVGIIDLLIPTLIALIMAYYMLAALKTIISSQGGEADWGERRKVFGWGIFILFIAVSIWGILKMLQNTFLSNSSGFGYVSEQVVALSTDALERPL